MIRRGGRSARYAEKVPALGRWRPRAERHEGIRSDVERDVEHGVQKTGKAVRGGAEDSENVIEEGTDTVGDAAKKTGRAIRDVFTDDDPDTDKDGK
jgi:hypothetical protein